MKKFYCIGKKWWDKINGNTYCNAKIIDENGDTITYIGFQYGYGHFYYQQAKKELEKTTKEDFELVDMGSDYTLKKIVKNNLF